jgi:hypothetical protein
MGNRFSMWIATAAPTPRSSNTSETIFQAVFRSSVGTRSSFEVNWIVVAPAGRASTVTTSCSSSV